ncbi:MAG TPA: LacI family DNA-binding transcriptional regulator [Lacunisphaera sp.]
MPSKSGSSPAVTIYEIAEHVGVSPAAVSSVLANRHVERRIAEETVRRIRAAAAELGYVPNMAGRRLRAHRSATRQFDLAILTSFEAPLPLVGQALHALQRAVDVQTNEHTRYAVAIEMFHAGRLKDKPGLLDSNRYHGVIITNTLPEDDQFLANAHLPYPVVIMGRRIANYYCVLEAPDFVGRRSAEVLMDAGCKHSVILHGRSLTQTTSNRLEAFNRTLMERTKRPATALVSDGLLPQQGAATIEAYLAGGGRLDGLFAVTDSLAIGAYRAIKQGGRSIPGDVAVVGVGDYDLAEYFDPPLTTVAGANDAMVAEAVPLLFRILRGEKHALREVLVVPPVFVRDSTNKLRTQG